MNKINANGWYKSRLYILGSIVENKEGYGTKLRHQMQITKSTDLVDI